MKREIRMKKNILIFTLTLLLSLSACSIKENDSKKEASANTFSPQSSSETENISATRVTYYLEKITGKIMLIDQYEQGSTKYISQLLKAEVDVNEAISEIKADGFTLSTEAASGALLELSDTVNSMISSGIDANYSNVQKFAKTLGSQTSNIANKFGNGNLPPTMDLMIKSLNK